MTYYDIIKENNLRSASPYFFWPVHRRKLVEARVPTAVTALLRLRASCNGKTLTEQALARMAVDVQLGERDIEIEDTQGT